MQYAICNMQYAIYVQVIIKNNTHTEKREEGFYYNLKARNMNINKEEQKHTKKSRS